MRLKMDEALIDYKRLLEQTRVIYKKAETQTSMDDFEEKPIEEKPKYSQDWPNYNMAKTNESKLFKELIMDLLLAGVEDDINNRGFSTREKIFCMCIKIYYGSDLRKCESMLKEMKEAGYIYRVPCFKSICNFFNDKKLAKVIDDLILCSALPVSQLEEVGAVDSTGFSVHKYDSWQKYKWGKHTGKQRVTRKLHVYGGCHTNIIYSAEVTRINVGDAPMLPTLVGNKPKLIPNMKDFVADKAYSSKKILKFLYNLGLNPIIPFRKNVTGKRRGSIIWGQMFHYFKYCPEDFNSRYHIRSNIETTINMLKTRFGHHLMTKTLTANVNELKAKCLVHNICCLIVECFESSIFLDFVACVSKASLCKEK